MITEAAGSAIVQAESSSSSSSSTLSISATPPSAHAEFSDWEIMSEKISEPSADNASATLQETSAASSPDRFFYSKELIEANINSDHVSRLSLPSENDAASATDAPASP